MSPSLLDRLDLLSATSKELASRNRLMPRRWDYVALEPHSEAVSTYLQPLVKRGQFGVPAGTILVDKGWRGSRPVNELSLTDRIIYRALVDCLSQTQPEHLTSREPVSEFKRSALATDNTKYVTKTDVAAYYEFVDHELLEEELLAQTSDEAAIEAVVGLLGRVMRRRVGLPQVHKCSDVLGDIYIDPVRRRLTRLGYTVFTYSDDFRICSPSLGSARSALDACAIEVRQLGLVLNERKTFTYHVKNYRKSLDSFELAERRLFEAGDDASLLDLDVDLYDDEGELSDETANLTLGPIPAQGEVDQDEAIEEGAPSADETQNDPNSPQANAAQRAWRLWIEEDESEDAQGRNDAAITQTLLSRALARLGAIGDPGPLANLSLLLRYEPALTPQIARYLQNYAQNGPESRTAVRDALDGITSEESTSAWQSMWLAEVAGSLIKSKRRRTHYDWLAQCVDTASSGLAATAAAAMGRLAIGDPSALASALDRVEREWRLLVLWGLARIDPALAERCEDFCVGEATNQGNQPMRPPVQSLRAEGAIALLRQTVAQHKTLAARIPLDNPRRRLAAPRRDRVQVQRQATFIRLISITESFCAVRLTEYVENVVDITAHSIFIAYMGDCSH